LFYLGIETPPMEDGVLGGVRAIAAMDLDGPIGGDTGVESATTTQVGHRPAILSAILCDW
jgi:hypothetical protein